jgi:hypothetical protein
VGAFLLKRSIQRVEVLGVDVLPTLLAQADETWAVS